MQDLAQVTEVLRDQALSGVDAEGDLERCSAAGDIEWWIRLKTRSTGLPGISRGMKKLIVMATQAVIT